MATDERWLVVRAAGRRFALPASRVRRVARHAAPSAPPGAPGGTPALSLAQALGLASAPLGSEPLRVELEGDGPPLLVDAAEEVVESTRALPLPPLVRAALGAASFLAGAIQLRDETVLVVDPARAARSLPREERP